MVRWQFRGLGEEQRKAFYFDDIYDAKGKKYDIPVLIGGLAGSQRIYALGLMCKEEEVEQIWTNALEKPIDPVLVDKGEVQEVVYQGEELIRCGGLYKLPIPISTPGFDNAPYLTAGCWITKDPDTGVRNMGVYRGQIKGPLKTGIMWGSLKHTAMHWEKCNEKGIPLDAAIVIGGPPCITYAAVQPVPYGVDEVALAGGLARSPLEMVRCKTVDLEVPANADIVIEGRIPSDYLEPDGPFGEAHGYLDPGDLNGVFEVTCITHKKNPIYVSMISQLTPSESSKIKQSAYETLRFEPFDQERRRGRAPSRALRGFIKSTSRGHPDQKRKARRHLARLGRTSPIASDSQDHRLRRRRYRSARRSVAALGDGEPLPAASRYAHRAEPAAALESHPVCGGWRALRRHRFDAFGRRDFESAISARRATEAAVHGTSAGDLGRARIAKTNTSSAMVRIFLGDVAQGGGHSSGKRRRGKSQLKTPSTAREKA